MYKYGNIIKEDNNGESKNSIKKPLKNGLFMLHHVASFDDFG
jgi:hypothetical protein